VEIAPYERLSSFMCSFVATVIAAVCLIVLHNNFNAVCLVGYANDEC